MDRDHMSPSQILEEIESLAEELTKVISFERRKDIHTQLHELTERLREINDKRSQKEETNDERDRKY